MKKHIKQLIETYNKPDSLLVVSSYPKKNQRHSQGVCALAPFTKNTLLGIKAGNPNKKIIVLTMVLDKEEVYEEDDMLIVRCFKRNEPLSYLRLLQNAQKFSLVKDVLVEFEFSSFGDTPTTGLLPLLIWALKLTGKNITIALHQVILDLASVSGHVGLSKRNPLLYVLSFLLKMYYRIICFPAKSLVVLEENFKKRLATLVDEKKITVIPHGVDTQFKKTASKQEARKLLKIKQDEIVILYFGYITWYKGTDLLMQALQKTRAIKDKKVRLLIAGGPSFTQKKKAHYQTFLAKVERIADKAPHIQITGFVEEENIPLYFAASDLSILPYRTFMSSSGPFSLALAFEKPFLLSSKLEGLLASEDINESLREQGLTKDDVLFEMNQKDLIAKINRALTPTQTKKLTALSRMLGQKRSFDRLASNYLDVLSSGIASATQKSLALLYNSAK